MPISKEDHLDTTIRIICGTTPLTEKEVRHAYSATDDFTLKWLIKYCNAVPEPYLTALCTMRAREGERITNKLSDPERAVWIDCMVNTTVLTRNDAEEAIQGTYDCNDPQPIEVTLYLIQIVHDALGYSGHPLIGRYRYLIEQEEKKRKALIRQHQENIAAMKRELKSDQIPEWRKAVIRKILSTRKRL